MKITEAQVLKLLSLGGQLTADQLVIETSLSKSAVCGALKGLQRKGFLRDRSGLRRDAWCLAPAGERYVSTRPGKAAMDVAAC